MGRKEDAIAQAIAGLFGSFIQNRDNRRREKQANDRWNLTFQAQQERDRVSQERWQATQDRIAAQDDIAAQERERDERRRMELIAKYGTDNVPMINANRADERWQYEQSRHRLAEKTRAEEEAEEDFKLNRVEDLYAEIARNNQNGVATNPDVLAEYFRLTGSHAQRPPKPEKAEAGYGEKDFKADAKRLVQIQGDLGDPEKITNPKVRDLLMIEEAATMQRMSDYVGIADPSAGATGGAGSSQIAPEASTGGNRPPIFRGLQQQLPDHVGGLGINKAMSKPLSMSSPSEVALKGIGAIGNIAHSGVNAAKVAGKTAGGVGESLGSAGIGMATGTDTRPVVGHVATPDGQVVAVRDPRQLQIILSDPNYRLVSGGQGKMIELGQMAGIPEGRSSSAPTMGTGKGLAPQYHPLSPDALAPKTSDGSGLSFLDILANHLVAR